MSDLDHKVINFVKKRMRIQHITQKIMSEKTGIKIHSLRKILGNKRPLLLEEKFILFDAVAAPQEEILANLICDTDVFLLKKPANFSDEDFNKLIYLFKKYF